MSNRLIVESENDKFFIQALVNHLNINNVNISEINIPEEAYVPLGGSDQSLLEQKLNEIKKIISKNNIAKIGVILDADKSQDEKIVLINNAVTKIFPSIEHRQIEKVSSFIAITSEESLDIQIACYFINVDGEGELENLLRVIKSQDQDSTYADCLEAWQNCVEQNGKTKLDKKEFDKFWINNYIRFDTCFTDKDKKEAKSKSGFKYVMKNHSHIWDFEHDALDELKEFLKLFS